jgi:hypothetical protein
VLTLCNLREFDAAGAASPHALYTPQDKEVLELLSRDPRGDDKHPYQAAMDDCLMITIKGIAAGGCAGCGCVGVVFVGRGEACVCLSVPACLYLECPDPDPRVPPCLGPFPPCNSPHCQHTHTQACRTQAEGRVAPLGAARVGVPVSCSRACALRMAVAWCEQRTSWLLASWH